MDRAERITSVIREFDAQGHHRTGTAVDHASGEWLRAALEDAGAEAALEAYPFPRFNPGESFVECGAARVPGLPMFDATPTTPSGLTGVIGPSGEDADVGLFIGPPGAAAPELNEVRASGRYRAIVYVTTGGQPGLAPRNAVAFPRMGGVPVLQVSSERRAELEAIAARHEIVRLVSTGEVERGTASNVVGRIRGQDSAIPPLVVMTPRSGWWECASERGGGIACWLEIARDASRQPLRRDVLFLASTGHELGHWGLERFIESRETFPTSACLWLHLGASVGAALELRPLMFSSDADLGSIALESLAKAGAPPAQAAPRGTVPGGEAKNIHERGGRYVSFAGGSAVFHLQQDRWPDAVNVAAVSAYADACISIVRAADALPESAR